MTSGGLFTFFDAKNPEMLLKVLDGCAITRFYWVFYAATTNVGFELEVVDTQTGRVATFANPDGTAAAPLVDLSVFPCPVD